MKPSEAIDKIIDFYEAHGWCRNDFARAKNGAPVHIQDPRATNFCLMGAAEHMSNTSDVAYSQIVPALIEALDDRGIARFNDWHRSKQHLLRDLRRIRSEMP